MDKPRGNNINILLRDKGKPTKETKMQLVHSSCLQEVGIRM